MDIADGPEPDARTRRRALPRLLREAGRAAGDVRGIGVGVPGPVDFPDRAPRQPADHAGLGRILDPGLVRRTPRRRPVFVDNDVNIMALGEHWAHWREVEHLLT